MQAQNSNIKIPKGLFWIGVLGATAVALGALGAHALKNKISTGLITIDQLNGFDTAVKYQMYHTLGMLMIILLGTQWQSKLFKWAYYLFFAGIILFSGSLYLLCTRGLTGLEFFRVLGPITPIGGICFVAGWLCIAFAVYKKS